MNNTYKLGDYVFITNGPQRTRSGEVVEVHKGPHRTWEHPDGRAVTIRASDGKFPDQFGATSDQIYQK